MYLNCHTANSFNYGTLQVEDLFNEARRCGVHKIILTEINNTASYIEMLRWCAKYLPYENERTQFGETPYLLEIAVGIEFRQDDELLYIALAKNNDGFERLNRFLSYHTRSKELLPHRAPVMEDTFIIYPFKKYEPEVLRYNEFIAIRDYQLTKLAVDTSFSLYKKKFIALHPVTFHPPILSKQGNKETLVYKDYNIHRLLRSIANNTLLSKLHKYRQADKEEYMISPKELRARFLHYPELIEQAKKLSDQCVIHFTLAEDKNKKYFTGSKEKDLVYLRTETEKGYTRIYGSDKTIWNNRIEKELKIIDNKNFTAYYLISYDLILYAKQQGFDYVGRGSGANSTVAYCLGITNVDPIELDLYFERFLNEERVSPPDFDIDFSWDNRDEIYAYLFAKYGEEHVCLLGTHTTYQKRSVVRQLGKVFGLPKEEIDEIVVLPEQNRNRDHIRELIYRYAEYIKDLPANISIHAGGVLITEKPIYAYTATEVPPKGLPVSHFEMHSAEDFGIYKFDILSQRGLGHIKETANQILQNKGIAVDVHQFRKFKEDEKVKDLLRNSKAIGCFYVESPAMRMLLGKLHCDNYLTLVAASSIIRPGVASSGMMKTYIERFHAVKNGGTYEAIHPTMDALMKETYGVMVYQEDVIKVAHHFAGLTLTEADVLRRGMSGKYRSREEFQKVRDRFFEGCRARNYDEKIIDRVWFEIESFSGYSFAKGHSASYAVESYQSLYLKAHYPLEFMVGVINNFGGFYRTEFYFHEARMLGASIETACVNHSRYLTTIHGSTIYIGFIHIKSLETKVGQAIEVERNKNGSYTSLNNFLLRITKIGIEQVRILIRIGAFRFTGKTKQQLLWEAMLFINNAKIKPSSPENLFNTEPKEFPLPTLLRSSFEDAFDEIELLGFPLCDPFDLLPDKTMGNTYAYELAQKLGQQISIIGYVVTTKPTRTKKGDTMSFGTFYDAKGEVFDTVHFPNVHKTYPFRGRGFYLLSGKVTEDFGVYMIEVVHMKKLSMIHKRPEKAYRESELTHEPKAY
jgi:DNA-directed DNA polymerase III PolC